MTESIIAPELVALDVSAGTDKSEVIAYLAGRITDAGRSSSVDGLVEAALAREAQSATGLPGGIAIPHCRAAAVTAASLGFARLDPKVDFGAPDGGANLWTVAGVGAGALGLLAVAGASLSGRRED